MSRYSATERVGINAVEAILLNEFKWIFREQPIVDMGIDAHVELVENGSPSGKLIGLQIKTGKGNFHETKDAYVYYGDDLHLVLDQSLATRNPRRAHSRLKGNPLDPGEREHGRTDQERVEGFFAEDGKTGSCIPRRSSEAL